MYSTNLHNIIRKLSLNTDVATTDRAKTEKNVVPNPMQKTSAFNGKKFVKILLKFFAFRIFQ